MSLQGKSSLIPLFCGVRERAAFLYYKTPG